MTSTRTSRFCLAVLILFLTTVMISGCGGGSSSEPPPSNQPPTITSFTTSSSTVTPGSKVTLSWNVANATSMTLSDGSHTLATGPLPTGTVDTGALNATTTFTLSASGAGGQVQSSVTVTVSAHPPTVTLNATPNPVSAGGIVNLSWTTANATSLTINPPVPNEEGQLPLQNPPPGTAIAINQTTTFTATATAADGTTATTTLTVTALPPAPSVDFAVAPTSIVPGGAPCGAGQATPGATLSWNATNTTSLTITDASGATVTSAPPGTLPQGTFVVNPAATTTYAATAVGQASQTATATATVTVAQLVANPPSVAPGNASTLCWNFGNAASVTIDHGVGTFPGATGSASTGPLNSTTTFKATATDLGGNTIASASVTVNVSGLQSRVKHIIFFVQENRSFDNYFSKLHDYMESRGFPNDLNQTPPAYDPTVKLTGRQGREVAPFHQRTVCTDNLSPAWRESHADIHLKGGKYLMDNFMKMTASIHGSADTNDPNGDRAMGYYDETDLPYYYELATQFGTSDTWFSPVLTNTVDNRFYLFAGTSFGHVNAQDQSPPGGWPQPTIFELLTAHKISWKYFHIDDVFYAAHFAGWNQTDAQGNFVNRRVRPVGTPGVVTPGAEDWFSILADPKADQLLPSVSFIESGSGGSFLDEHPLNNIQKGAAFSQQIINALMKSSAWQSSIFIFTFDEGGGLYDHVPPVPMPQPDGIQPILRPGDPVDNFDKTGFRVPLVVVSPWTKPHFVSHQPRDFTAILKLIEDRFGLPPLTKRDAGQISMEEFFDFSSPARLTAPGGGNWADVLPAQPDVLGRDCTNADRALETAP